LKGKRNAGRVINLMRFTNPNYRCKNPMRSKPICTPSKEQHQPPKGEVNKGKALLRSKSGTKEKIILSPEVLVSTTKINPKTRWRLKPTKPK
jgi:hypothetical protein